MILGFKKRFPWGNKTNFEDKILKGVKVHTIREDIHGRWCAGRHIHMATGVRTKKYNCFLEQDCISIQAIQINYYECSVIEVIIDGELIYKHGSGLYSIGPDKMEMLSKNDGFDSINDFFRFFNTDFRGRIIHWTDLKY